MGGANDTLSCEGDKNSKAESQDKNINTDNLRNCPLVDIVEEPPTNNKKSHKIDKDPFSSKKHDEHGNSLNRQRRKTKRFQVAYSPQVNNTGAKIDLSGVTRHDSK